MWECILRADLPSMAFQGNLDGSASAAQQQQQQGQQGEAATAAQQADAMLSTPRSSGMALDGRWAHALPCFACLWAVKQRTALLMCSLCMLA
jgi:hypothetical protein